MYFGKKKPVFSKNLQVLSIKKPTFKPACQKTCANPGAKALDRIIHDSGGVERCRSCSMKFVPFFECLLFFHQMIASIIKSCWHLA
jgi:hypothetical protein